MHKSNKIIKKFLTKLSYPIFSFICFIYIWIIGLTSKIIYKGKEIPQKLRFDGTPFIFGVWHNKQLLLCFIERYNNNYCMVSESKDGEYVSRVANLFGIKTIRGSTSKGAVKALVRMIKLLKTKKNVAITPDGPRGPVYEVQPGVVLLAQKSGCPFIPLSYHAKKKKIFPSWDNFEVPFPFNTICVSYGTPITISKDISMEKAKEIIKKSLNENKLNAEKYFLDS